jgi:hypothetical protein
MKSLSKLTVTSAVLALAFISAAAAQNMRVSVPFGFRAGEQTLPAGTYRVALSQSQQRVTMQQLGGSAACFLPVKAYSGPGTPERATLVFNQYGSSYFLTRVNAPGVAQGAELFTSRAEREIAKAQSGVKKLVVSASGM